MFAQAWISVIAQAEPHKGYQFRLSVADANGALPDAWRFDAGGCQPPGMITIDVLVPAGTTKACPSFQGATASTQVKSFTLATPDLGLPAATGVVLLRNSYPFGWTSLATQRYYVGAVIFDHLHSNTGVDGDPETCDGLERGMCLRLLPASSYYVRMDGVQVPFEIDNAFVTANGGTCGAVPAAASTWGQIKGQYRR
jgi:hypothetical protein